MAARWRGRTSNDLLRRRIIRSGAFSTGEPGSPSLTAWLGEDPPKAHKVRRTSDDKAVVPTEHQEQVKVIQWWRFACLVYHIPEYALFAVPNGGSRDVITASLLKAEGVRRGALDLILAYPTKASHGLFLEMKRQNGSPSDVKQEQRDYIEYLQSVGYAASVHWSGDSAIEAIKAYLS